MSTSKEKINQVSADGKREGYWEEKFHNHKLCYKGYYINDEINGYWEWFYYSNGSLQCKGNYINGKANGIWEEYYSNGQLYLKGNYINGKPEKEFNFYNKETGNLENIMYYVNI